MINANQAERSYISKFKTLLINLTEPSHFTVEDGIKYWQDHLLLSILLISSILGFFVYIPSILLCIKEGLWFTGVVDTLIYFFVIMLFSLRSIPFRGRAVSFIAISYILGLVLLLTVGPFGGGPVWLFAFPIITVLLLGTRASITALAMNVSTIIVTGILLSSGYMKWEYTAVNATEKWLVTSINFIFLNIVVTILAATILKELQALLEQRKDLIGLLQQQHNDLLKANEKLQSEIIEHRKTEKSKKNVEIQLYQAHKMESIGRLAGGVAHDYNNILSVILGYTELALEKVDPNDSLHGDLEEIYTAAKRSTDITHQLLAFARKQTIVPKVLDLNKALEGMLKMLRQLIGEDIDLAWHPRANLWPVRMDPSQIDQILANLCVNARDAIADVGKVTIETGKVKFDPAYCDDHAGFVPGEFVLLAVSDNGSGMDKETLDNLFEPFFTTKGMGAGTGLGLSTVYGIVKQNDGFINVYSEPGKGTTFRIYLPRHAGEAEEIAGESTAEFPEGRGETVLLVEDDGSILKLGERILKSLGYTVLSANSTAEATRLAEEHAGEIELLITDVVMPEMNGRELSEQLHLLYPKLKTVFMSGYTANVIAHRGVLEEGVFFMPKPFSKKDMAGKVREALESAKT